MNWPAKKKPFIPTTPPNHSYRNEEESSPTKGNNLFKAQQSEYVNNLKAKKDNYSTALDLYSACYQHEMPQKCLKHLNFITLYCNDEHKLLCVNCLYGSTAHKNHSVTPSNSSLNEIKRDNEKNLKQIDEQIKQIREVETKVNENKKLIQYQNNYILQQITKEFTEMRRLLDQKQKYLKDRVIRDLQKAGTENEITRKEIQWWRQQTSKIRNNLPREVRDGNGEQAEIYKHLVFDLMQNQRLQSDKLVYFPSKDELEYQYLTEVKQLKQIVKNKVEENNRRNGRLF